MPESEYRVTLGTDITSVSTVRGTMRGKIGIVVGLAAGYVLGSRAGRERYEQIKAGAATLMAMPAEAF